MRMSSGACGMKVSRGQKSRSVGGRCSSLLKEKAIGEGCNAQSNVDAACHNPHRIAATYASLFQASHAQNLPLY